MEPSKLENVAQSSSSSNRIFPFIVSTGHTKPDLGTRSLVKRHVMQDIGKARRESSTFGKINQLQLPNFLAHDQALGDGGQRINSIIDGGKECAVEKLRVGYLLAAESDDVDNTPSRSMRLAREIEAHQSIERIGARRLDPFIAYPIDMKPGSWQLMDCIFDPRVNTLKSYRDAYYSCAIDDATAFTQLLANAALLRALFESKGANLVNDAAVTYHSRAINLTNQRLGHVTDSLSKGMIATVLMMAAYNQIIQDFEAWNVHMSGLERIIELRGGIETLGPSTQLRLLIYWHDLAGSCTLDQPPRFKSPKRVSTITHLQNNHGSNLFKYLRNTWQRYYPDHPQLKQNLDNLLAFNTSLHKDRNWSTGRVSAEAWASGFCMTSLVEPLLCHRCVVVPDNIASLICESVRLGGLLYLAEIKRQYGTYPVLMGVHLQKLRSLLQDYKTDWQVFTPLKTWTLVMAAIEAESGPDKAWLMSELVEILRLSHLAKYDDLKNLLEDLFWYTNAHERKLRTLWSDIGHLVSPQS